MLLTRVLEQRVVFEVITLSSAVSPRSTAVVALPCLCHTQVAGHAWGHVGRCFSCHTGTGELEAGLGTSCSYIFGRNVNILQAVGAVLFPCLLYFVPKVPIAVRARFVLTTRHIRSLSLLLPPFSSFVRRQEGIALSRVIIKQFVIYASLCPCVYRAQIW